jgi:hypothetical protein
MINKEVKKAAKLNEFDRRVLLAYSGISLETGAKATAEAAETKAIHKSILIKV